MGFHYAASQFGAKPSLCLFLRTPGVLGYRQFVELTHFRHYPPVGLQKPEIARSSRRHHCNAKYCFRCGKAYWNIQPRPGGK